MEQEPRLRTDSPDNNTDTAVKPASPGLSIWTKIGSYAKKGGRFLLGALPAFLVIVVAVGLVIFGIKNFQVGGLLSSLLGSNKKPLGKTAVDLANSIPKDRVGPDGRLIEHGVPDSEGLAQATVVEIQPPGIFGDPKEVKFVPHGSTTPVTVRLPDGVTASDVDKVVFIKPEVTVVTVKDTSKAVVTATDIDGLLAKYRK